MRTRALRAGYRFADDWWLPGTPDRVAEILVDLEHYPSWWPQVVAVASLGPNDARLLIRSVLPYTLDICLHAVHREPPVLEVEVYGDLDGTVRFLLEPETGPSGRAGTRLRLEQRVEARGLLAIVTPVARPLLAWNHHRMMTAGMGRLAASL